jgi:tripartite-type tricarboxylate transporter receptor subunit TctC
MHMTCPAVPTLSLVAGNATVRVLAITAREPTAPAPGLQPVAGSVPGYELNGWYGMLGPTGTPRAIVQRLNQQLTRIVGEPVVRERMLGVGAQAGAGVTGEFWRTPGARDRTLEPFAERSGYQAVIGF